MYIHTEPHDNMTRSLLSELKASDPNTMIFQSDSTFLKHKYWDYYFTFAYQLNKNTFDNLSIIEAVYKNNLPELEILLQNPLLQPDFFLDLAIVIASAFGHMHLIKILLEFPRVDITTRPNSAIISAVTNGHIDTVKFILGYNTPNANCIYHLCQIAIKKTHFEILKLLCFDRKDLDFTIQKNYLTQSTLEIRNELVADTFFEFMLHITGSSGGNFLIRAVRNNQYLIVKKMLNNAIPKIQLNRSLCVAIKKNNIPMVKLLLSDSRINPAAESNLAIFTASNYHSDSSIMKLLLADPRVDPTIDQNMVLINAIKNECMFRLLLADHRIKDFPPNLISKIIKKEKIKILKMVMADDRMKSPIRLDHLTLTHYAIPVNYVNDSKKEIIKLCLADNRYDGLDNSYLLYCSIEKHDTGVCKLLLADPRTNLATFNNEIFFYIFGVRQPDSIIVKKNNINLAALVRHPSINLSSVRNYVRTHYMHDPFHNFLRTGWYIIAAEMEKYIYGCILMMIRHTQLLIDDIIGGMIGSIYIRFFMAQYACTLQYF